MSGFANWIAKPWMIGVLLGLVALLYLPSLNNDFAVDDYPAIIDNELVKGGLGNTPEIFQHSFYYGYDQRELANEYRPLASLLFALEYSVFGKNAAGYHGVSILLYLLLLWLIYCFVK
ncbi:MAG: hypothetical protein LPK45_08660 [Bacteroidota bacterium]|nr:hypothetical protein [Bacteroidota bacterium]MDX5431147.1 hypothetical protein [Bacteroidota bacterium]MDX5469894.1 hypothetical protein [Bacteroidota bacterium]